MGEGEAVVMMPAEAAKLKVGESRVWFQGDMIVSALPNGIYPVLAVTDETRGGRRVVRVLISKSPEVWARPENLGRVSR